MPAYCLRYNSGGVETGAEHFFDQDAFQAILLAQRHLLDQPHTESAELWTDGSYVTTLCLADNGEYWRLYREPAIVARSDALNAQPDVPRFFFHPPQSHRPQPAPHHPAADRVASQFAW